MASDVKRATTRREEKAQATRNRILDAALALFLDDGYTTTTIAAIADGADVAVQTVYAVFGNKKAILEALRKRALMGDATGPLKERGDWKAMEKETDPATQLRMLAVIATGIGAAMGPIYEVMSGAATSDPEIADAFRRLQESRHEDQSRVGKLLARRGALRDGISADDATDAMWVIANPRTYRSLVVERGWSEDKYVRWLGDTLVAALLA